LRYGDFTSSIPEIGAALGADFVVEGSIQSVGDNVRVTLQLIQADDDNHIWAEAFDRDPQSAEDLLQFHKELSFELAIRIYQVLEKTVPPTGEAKRIRKEHLASLESQLDSEYAAYWVNTTGTDRLDRYRSLENIISEIIRIDPDNESAHDRRTGLSFTLPELGLREFFDPEWRKEFYLILKQAYIVNPDGFDVNKHLGIYYFNYENRPNRAIPYSRKAVQIERELRGTNDIYTYWILLESLYDTGQNTAALEIVERASEENMVIFSGLAWFWTFAYTVNGLWENAIDFLDEQVGQDAEMTVEKTNDELNAILSYRFTRARILARWSGDSTFIREFFEENQDSPLFPLINKAYYHFYTENYQTTLDLLSRIQLDSDTSSISSVDLAEMRGWSYLRTGNPALAQSYFKGYLKELLDSPRARWQQTFRPDWYAAELSYAYACLENREEALKWAATAIEAADPSRNYQDYFNTLGRLAFTYFLTGEFQQGCALIDQILSTPSGWTTGDFLLNPQLKGYRSIPEFEAVLRKHADQLKDPAILDAFFAKTP
jgi:tetratricopeptide (TPR) repeat protein